MGIDMYFSDRAINFYTSVYTNKIRNVRLSGASYELRRLHGISLRELLDISYNSHFIATREMLNNLRAIQAEVDDTELDAAIEMLQYSYDNQIQVTWSE